MVAYSNNIDDNKKLYGLNGIIDNNNENKFKSLEVLTSKSTIAPTIPTNLTNSNNEELLQNQCINYNNNDEIELLSQPTVQPTSLTISTISNISNITTLTNSKY